MVAWGTICIISWGRMVIHLPDCGWGNLDPPPTPRLRGTQPVARYARSEDDEKREMGMVEGLDPGFRRGDEGWVGGGAHISTGLMTKFFSDHKFINENI
jgi:hypothetical protein